MKSEKKWTILRADLPVRKCLQAVNPLAPDCLTTLAEVRRESQCLDFKGQFNTSNRGDWVELVKDIVAMANSGGGYLIFGKDNNGNPTHHDFSNLLQMDQANLVDKINAYVDADVGDVAIAALDHSGDRFAVIHVPGTTTPIIMREVGSYPDPKNQAKQKWVFRPGMMFFRHGSKSEPAKQSDIDKFFNSYLKEMRSHLIKGMKIVTETPVTHKLVKIPKELTLVLDEGGTPIRVSGEKGSIPVKGLADGSPYQSIDQEVLGIISGMRTDPNDYASETQLWRLYTQRKQIRENEDAFRVLLISSLYRHAPPCYWASKLSHDALKNTLERVLNADSYPSVNAAIWVAFCWGSLEAKELLEGVRKNSKYRSAKNASTKALRLLDRADRILHLWAPASITIGPKVMDVKDLKQQFAELEAILDDTLSKKGNQSEIKLLDRLCFGPQIAEKQIGRPQTM
jgi:hypothetical protein